MKTGHQHYKDSFWQGYSFLKENFQKTKHNFYQLNYVFTRLSTLHLYYSNCLQQIYTFIKSPSLESNLTHSEAFLSFLTYLKDESAHHKLLSDKTKDLIKKHLEPQYPKFETCFKSDEVELKKQQHDNKPSTTLTIVNSIQHFEQIQDTCGISFNKLKEHEIKYYNHLSKALKEMLKRKEYKNIDKIEKDFKIDQAKQEYKCIINEAISKRNDYINKFIEHADEYENIDKMYIDTLRKTIMEYTTLINAYCSERQHNITQNVIPKVNDINIENDINNFILKHETFGLPPSTITFVNYSVNRSYVPEAEPKKDDPNRKLIIDSVHNFIAYFSEVDEEKIKLRNDVKEYFIKAENGVLTEEQHEQLITLFENVNNGISYQLSFLGFLNEKRSGIKEISVDAFKSFTRILLKILELTQRDDMEFAIRYKVCNWCFVLSETFYIKDNETQQNVYLISEINKTGIFDQVDWVCFFKYILLDNLSGRGNYKNYKFQLTLKEMDISKEFETKIFTLAQNLKFLNKSQEDIIKLVENLFQKYHQKKEMFEKVKEQLPFFLS